MKARRGLGSPRQGVVLAAGEGTRLRPLTLRTPKALVPFFGRALVDLAVDRLVAASVERVAINAHHLAGQVARHVEGVLAPRYPEVSFHVEVEERLLGTGGALWNLRRWLQPEPFWVLNADVVSVEPLLGIATTHAALGVDATLLVSPRVQGRELKRLLVSPEGLLQGLHEPWHPDGLAFCGTQLAEATLLDRLPAGPSCSLRAGHLPYLDQGLRVGVHRTTRFWSDMGTAERLAQAHLEALPELGVLLGRGGFLQEPVAPR